MVCEGGSGAGEKEPFSLGSRALELKRDTRAAAAHTQIHMHICQKGDQSVLFDLGKIYRFNLCIKTDKDFYDFLQRIFKG